jgi:hypothetical protein
MQVGVNDVLATAAESVEMYNKALRRGLSQKMQRIKHCRRNWQTDRSKSRP